jgi:hypothetical protein
MYEDDHFAFEILFIYKSSAYFLFQCLPIYNICCPTNVSVHFVYFIHYSGSWFVAIVVILDNRQITIQP